MGNEKIKAQVQAVAENAAFKTREWAPGHFGVSVEIDHRRVYHSEYTYQIGKWLVCCTALYGVFERMTAICVVDDFGNLVRVPS